jgi:UDP-glucose 4-epimerase
MKIIVTGAAGFVGSNLVDQLLLDGHKVLCIDNLSTGFIQNISHHDLNKNFKCVILDLTEEIPQNLFEGYHAVVHLAALADIRYNVNNFSDCLNKNIIATNNVIEQCIKNKIQKFLFASTCSVYGDTLKFPTKENEIKNQTSIYSSTKIASEMILEGFANTFDFQAYSLRFVSMLGPRYSHGHIFDFTKKILNGKQLTILGSGDGIKSYLHIKDAISAITLLLDYNSKNKYEAYNVGSSEIIKLKYSVDTIVDHLNYKGDVEYGQGLSGWIGDVSVISPCVEKLKSLGWEPKYSTKQGIVDTIDYLVNNQWIFE